MSEILTPGSQIESIDLSAEQSAALLHLEDMERKRVFYGGQAGGGKTVLASIFTLHRRTNLAGSRGYWARVEPEAIKLIKDSILKTFFEVCAIMGFERDRDFYYSQDRNRIEFPNGSEQVFLDLHFRPSDPEYIRLGSTEYTDGVIEEGTAAHKRGADIIFSRTRWKIREYGVKPKQLITGNPAEGWIREEVVKPYFEGGKMREGFVFIPASLESNPNKDFVDDYRELLDSLPWYDKARLLHGDWDAMPKSGGEFYRHDPVVVDNEPHIVDLPLHITFDFNVNPYVTLIVSQIRGKKVIILDEICLESPRNKTRFACHEFVRRYPPQMVNGLYIYGDPAGRAKDTRTDDNDYQIILDELNAYRPEFRVPASAPPVKTRGDFIDAIVNEKKFGLELVICRKNRKTIADFNQLKVASDGTKAKSTTKNPDTGVSFQKHGHCTDAVDYLITSAFPVEFNNFKRKTTITPEIGSYDFKHGW